MKKWTKEEDDYLIKNHSITLNKEIATKLNRSLASVENRVRTLNIGKTSTYTEEENEYLRNNYANMSHEEIAKHLGRDESSIRYKCSSLGLIKTPRKHYTKDEISQLKNAVSLEEKLELAYKFNISYYALSQLMKRYGYESCKLSSRFNAIVQRCYDKTSISYENYGGRGITICDEWLNDDRKFIAWAIQSGYSHELQIDRIDNDGPYCPNNCKWSTRKSQSNNRRTNILLTAFNETKTVKEWSEDDRCAIKYATLWYRIKQNKSNVLTPEEILTLNQKELLERKKQYGLL